jgi:hypothetical protein
MRRRRSQARAKFKEEKIMKPYDIFKSQGGYGVATKVYLDGPVVGAIRWFETEDKAQEWTENKRKYNKDYAAAEEKLQYCGSVEEAEKIRFPREEDYNLDKGVYC